MSSSNRPISVLPTARQPELRAALERLRANARVTSIVIGVSDDACPAACAVQGTYAKAETPDIPLEACSRAGGCNCRYLPVLNDIFP
ncbi:hypothetical protein LBMAG37_04230 [Anaerolineae bacterium]|nr:hypothetical protein EMGBS1_06950 [Chloroflexota bacterium]GBL36820.1 hypothetical protein EMGBD1_05070 [Anaerolineaceae bacterium]GDX67269.1 hypothetical protein LBMAG37_04230 [Anaerolineae bacterium]